MIEYRIGDVVDRLAEIPDGSIDLVVSSPPFLALRSYLPADHPDKHKEIGSEPTPAAFIDTLLGLTAEFDRVLAPHGSICIELGDTFAGGGQTGWHRSGNEAEERYRNLGAIDSGVPQAGSGWPLAKSLTGIPTLYTWSLAYGRNLLTGEPSPAGQWRIRNVIVWARPNPPVGALGDKFRPATSYITVACKGARRYFDLDAVRTEFQGPARFIENVYEDRKREGASESARGGGLTERKNTHAGAPPLDWHADDHPEDGDWLWKLSTQPYKGSHYATYPLTLPKRLIEAMCPLRVCTTCGVPSTRIVDEVSPRIVDEADAGKDGTQGRHVGGAFVKSHTVTPAVTETLGWTDCGHDTWRTGVVLDPFAGSGTTLEAAQLVGRHAIGIDLDARNAHLAVERVGMFLEVVA